MLHRHAWLLVALAALVAALVIQSAPIRSALRHGGVLRWMLPPPALGQSAATRKTLDEEIYPPGTLVNHAYRLGRLEEGLREFHLEHVRDITDIKAGQEWTNRFLFGSLVGLVLNLVTQLRSKVGRGEGQDGRRDGRDR